VARRKPGPAASIGLPNGDPDRISARLAYLRYQPFVTVLEFEDYVSRDVLLESIASELKEMWGVRVTRFDISTVKDLNALLATSIAGIAFVTGIDRHIPDVGIHLNGRRDELAERRTVLWLRVGQYAQLATVAPDLSSIVIPDRPLIGGAVMWVSALEPELKALERTWKIRTAQLLDQIKRGERVAVPDEIVHRWVAIARVLDAGEE
jgi:hypothetical protein